MPRLGAGGEAVIPGTEWFAYHDYWSVQLARRGGEAAGQIGTLYSDSELDRDRALLELAARLQDGPEPPPIRDVAGAGRYCAWCGRTAPPNGLADESMGGPPSWSCTDADLDSCLRTHDGRVREWKETFPGYRTTGERHPLGALGEAAQQALDAADAARTALQSWQQLQAPAAASAAEISPPAPPSPAPGPFPVVAGPVPWEHAAWNATLRHPAGRQHLVSKDDHGRPAPRGKPARRRGTRVWGSQYRRR
jgi:hypothetical protein